MDPVTMIVTALASGVIRGMGDNASTAVTDAYHALKTRLARVVDGNEPARMALAQHEADPEVWRGPLIKLLAQTGADRDEQILDAARQVLELTDSTKGRSGRYVDARGANVGNIGDNARQKNSFGAPPAGK